MKLADLKNKNLLSGLAVLAILAIFLVVWPPKQKPTQQPEPIPRTDVPKNQLPAGFPQEIPIEIGARVIQNYELTAPDGRHQATRAFESKKSVTENYQFYLDLLPKSGWTVLEKNETSSFAKIFASKAEATLSIGISKNSNTGIVEVSLDYTK